MADNDYGYLNGQSSPEVDTSTVRRTQVYEATHKGEGYLPFMYRSFISFSYGGKNIEDFGLITVTDGDRMNRNGYADFEDITSNYSVLDGQYHWGTHYQTNHIEFTLATDGITQKQLDDFLFWFRPGEEKELILAEHPNRAIMARVSQPPELHVLPFEQHTSIKIAGNTYKTSTTLYRGDISLSLVMDKPTWYAKINIFGFKENNVYYDQWEDANGQKRSVYDDPDALKIAIEDGIPISGMVTESMLFGNNTFANMGTETGAIIAPDSLIDEQLEPGTLPPDSDDNWRSRIAVLDGQGLYVIGARIMGAIMDETTGFASVASGQNEFFYYAGNAPSKPILTFSLTPTINQENYYISSPSNKFSNDNKTYNTITIESVHKKEFRFTLPGVYTGYNQAIYLFKHMNEGDSWVDIGTRIRDQVKHHYARAWAAKIGSYLQTQNKDGVRASDIVLAQQLMGYFLKDNEGKMLPGTFVFNSETGEATGTINIRLIISDIPENDAAWSSYGIVNEIKENVGDMVRSDYLIIEDKNYPDENGNIVSWRNSNDTTKAYSHRIYHDVTNGLQNLFIQYNNMYL